MRLFFAERPPLPVMTDGAAGFVDGVRFKQLLVVGVSAKDKFVGARKFRTIYALMAGRAAVHSLILAQPCYNDLLNRGRAALKLCYAFLESGQMAGFFVEPTLQGLEGRLGKLDFFCHFIQSRRHIGCLLFVVAQLPLYLNYFFFAGCRAATFLPAFQG
jgi:hypothetical protein